VSEKRRDGAREGAVQSAAPERIKGVRETDDLPLRLAGLVALLSAALALGIAGLIPGSVCLLAMVLLLVLGLALPRLAPGLARGSPQRSTIALVGIGLLIAATAGSGPGALFSGELSGALGAAATELALPGAIPTGLLAALAAGGLVAVSLELTDRRGVQSALVLSTAVLGLASVAAPGTQLLTAVIPGWPAVMFALSRLAGQVSTAPDPHPPIVKAPASSRAVARWQVVPVLAVITVSLVAVGLARVTGVASIGERSSFGPGGFGTAGGGRSSTGYLGGSMDLTARGALRSDPLLQVSDTSPRLWRAGTLDEYTGRAWLVTAPPAGLPQIRLDPNGTAQVLDPSQPAASGAYRVDQVRPMSAGVTQILTPGRLLSLSSTRLSTGGRAFAAAGDRVTMVGGGGSGEYQVRSQALAAVDDPGASTTLTSIERAGDLDPAGNAAGNPAGNAAGKQVDQALDPRWTALPPTVPTRVTQLGRTLVAGASSRLAAVQAIEAELAIRMTYTLDSPVPPPGADAVDDVLFVSHSGFCEQFATAEVVLLRAAGVPARMAVGFSGGDPAEDGFRTLRRSDAHAWVEVWFPGIGWVTSDPTPAAATGSETWWQSIRDTVRSWFDQPWAWLAAILLLSLVSGSGFLLIRRRSKALSGADLADRRVDPDLAAAFTRLEADLRAEGRPRAPNETVAALAWRLARPHTLDQPDPAAADALRAALQVLERALYAPQPPTRQESLTAATAIDRRQGAPPPSRDR
jgi:hypothetical protein